MQFLATLRPAAPAAGPHGTVVWWLVAAVLLGLIVVSGMVLTSRR